MSYGTTKGNLRVNVDVHPPRYTFVTVHESPESTRADARTGREGHIFPNPTNNTCGSSEAATYSPSRRTCLGTWEGTDHSSGNGQASVILPGVPWGLSGCNTSPSPIHSFPFRGCRFGTKGSAPDTPTVKYYSQSLLYFNI